MAHQQKIGPLVLAAAAVAGAVAVYSLLLRPKHLRWGASDEEANGYLPGDEFVPKPASRATHAITIDAPPEFVWPWLVQLGQDKAGFYSYTALENLFGCHMRNAYEIHPEWQTPLQVGDLVKFHPKAPRVPIIAIEPLQYMILGQDGQFTWGMVLDDLGERTRLIVRAQNVRRPLVASAIDFAFWEPAHFIMERKMMLTVKALAEESYQDARRMAVRRRYLAVAQGQPNK
jgi:hypothetical protein